MPGPWRKSSRSQGSGGNCVEARHTSNCFEVRDSKAPQLGALAMSRTDWTALLSSATN